MNSIQKLKVTLLDTEMIDSENVYQMYPHMFVSQNFLK